MLVYNVYLMPDGSHFMGGGNLTRKMADRTRDAMRGDSPKCRRVAVVTLPNAEPFVGDHPHS